MAVNTENLTISSLDTMNGYDNAGDLLFTIDEMQDCTIANTEEKVDITGRGGRKLSSLKRNKAVTISGTNGLFSGELLAVQTGNDVQKAVEAEVDWIEIATVKSNAAATEFKAVGVTGNELRIYIKNENGTKGTAYTQVAATPEAGQFTYSPETKAITFSEGDITEGQEIIISYRRRLADAAIVSNTSDVYSKTCRLIIDATAKDTCDAVYHVQFQIPRADFSGNFDFTLGGDQVVQAFEAESLSASGACSTASSTKGKLWDMVIFGDDTVDAE